jgi:hypothetical protein
MVVVAKQVAEAMHSEALKLPVQAGATRAAAGGLHGDHDVAEKNPIARRIGIALNLLHVETQHIGRAIEAAVLAIERSDLVIAGEQQGCRRAHASQLSQGRAQAIRDPAVSMGTAAITKSEDPWSSPTRRQPSLPGGRLAPLACALRS